MKISANVSKSDVSILSHPDSVYLKISMDSGNLPILLLKVRDGSDIFEVSKQITRWQC